MPPNTPDLPPRLPENFGIGRLFAQTREAVVVANVVGRIAGTGIGLAGACQIAQRHGGSIEVSSQEGRGSTFTVRLPLTPGGQQG